MEITNEFDILAPDIQRSLIDIAIKEKTDTISLEGKTYTLPHLIQLTYFCKKCSQSYPARVFLVDLLSGITEKRLCPKCREDIFVVHKTVPLDYALIKLGSATKDIYDYFEDE